MKILLTNDDGVQSKGLQYLYNLLRIAYDVTVVAPERDMSGCSHSITLRTRLRVKQITTKVYSVTGTPTDCIVLGLNSIIDERPDMVISGINLGPNLGFDITYSGTVGGALEGAIWGVPSLAISITGVGNFEDTSGCLFKMLSLVKENSLKKFLLNINVPPEPRGIKVTKLGKRVYENVVTTSRKYYEIGGTPVHAVSDGQTDVKAVEDGYISITPISLDFLEHNLFKKLSFLNEGFDYNGISKKA